MNSKDRLQWKVNLELMAIYCPICGRDHDIENTLPQSCPGCGTRLRRYEPEKGRVQ